MRVYTVHAPSADPDAAEHAVFVKEGLSWPALIVPILWILWHRLWLTLLGWIIFLLVVAWAGRLLDDRAATALAIIGQVLFALEANNIRRASLARRGWRDIGESFGRNRAEAEIRFYHGQVAAPAPEPVARPAVVPPAMVPRSTFPVPPGMRQENIIGLFPEAER